MNSPILKLQADSVNESVSVAELLRSAYLVARKLKIDEFVVWINSELNGYESGEIPSYRKLHGQLQIHDPYYGYQPLHVKGKNEEGTDFSIMDYSTPIGKIENDVLSARASGDSEFLITFTPEVEELIRGCMNRQAQPLLCIHISSFNGVLDTVRNKVLQWSLDLEADGITGDGVLFHESEREKAQNTNYQIENYIAGNVSGGQVQVGTKKSKQVNQGPYNNSDLKTLVAILERDKDALSLNETELAVFNKDIETIRSESASSDPEPTAVGSALRSAKSIAEGAVGNIVGSGVVAQISSMLGS